MIDPAEHFEQPGQTDRGVVIHDRNPLEGASAGRVRIQERMQWFVVSGCAPHPAVSTQSMLEVWHKTRVWRRARALRLDVLWRRSGIRIEDVRHIPKPRCAQQMKTLMPCRSANDEDEELGWLEILLLLLALPNVIDRHLFRPVFRCV